MQKILSAPIRFTKLGHWRWSHAKLFARRALETFKETDKRQALKLVQNSLQHKERLLTTMKPVETRGDSMFYCLERIRELKTFLSLPSFLHGWFNHPGANWFVNLLSHFRCPLNVCNLAQLIRLVCTMLFSPAKNCNRFSERLTYSWVGCRNFEGKSVLLVEFFVIKKTGKIT